MLRANAQSAGVLWFDISGIAPIKYQSSNTVAAFRAKMAAEPHKMAFYVNSIARDVIFYMPVKFDSN